MSISEYLDVFIGLAFVYLLLSLIVTIVFESVAQFTRLRARNLKRAISKLLEEPQTADKTEANAGKTLVDRFYEHPIVKSLSREKDAKSEGEDGEESKLSWWSIVWRFLRSIPHFSYIQSNTFATAAMNTLFPGQDLSSIDGKSLTSLVNGLPESKIKGVLETYIRTGDKTLKSLMDGVETWFNDTMDRLSGWFTRSARWISFVIGLIIAIGLNVDTFVVANALWREPALRANVAEYASENYKRYPPGQELGRVYIDSLRTNLSSLELPMGWNTYGPDSTVVARGAGWFDAKWSIATKWAPQHFIGWLFTALAISLGAHFWFDALNRLIKIRAAGRSPAEEAKKKTPKT